MSKNAVTTLEGQPIAYLPHLDEEAAKQRNGGVGGNVTMSRALAESAHGLTLNEARVMMLAMRCVDPRSSPYQYAKATEYVKVKVNAADFAEIADLKPDENGYTNRAAYEGLKSACDKLYERSATWTEGKKLHRMRWTWKSTYHEKEGWAEISFSPDLTRHIFMLGERFVRYRLEYARGLRSLYSSTLLRLLMTQKDTGFKTIKRYAILKPVAELNEKADMLIEWKESKRGRSVYSLQFTFSFVKKEKAVQGELEL
jgi:hypothetical protein